MLVLTLPMYSTRRGIESILNSNNLKNSVRILYPNRVIVNEGDVKAIERVLNSLMIKPKWSVMISNLSK